MFFICLFFLFFCCQFSQLKSLCTSINCFRLFAAIPFSTSCFSNSHTEGEKKRKREKNNNMQTLMFLRGRVQKPQREASVEGEAEQSLERHCCQCRKTRRSEKKCGFFFFLSQRCKMKLPQTLYSQPECNAI